LDESDHACTRSELRGASCEDWKSALRACSHDEPMQLTVSKQSDGDVQNTRVEFYLLISVRFLVLISY
jgi:hypothetical protein